MNQARFKISQIRSFKKFKSQLQFALLILMPILYAILARAETYVSPSKNNSPKNYNIPTRETPREVRAYRFTPHITAEARTREKGKFSFQRAVGANLNTNLLLASLTYSIHDRLEIGAVIANYFVGNHIANINLKYNFYRTRDFYWSVGMSSSQSKLNNEDSDPDLDNVKIALAAVQILLNYLPEGSRFKFGMNVNLVNTSLVGIGGKEADFYEIGAAEELGFDVSHEFHDTLEITTGGGWLRESGLTALEDIEFGVGGSVRWYRPDQFISSPTFGLHFTPSNNSFELLVSTSFY